jgi:murein DD-endopeptidase MepM/ murein hydrolase activator NlpD
MHLIDSGTCNKATELYTYDVDQKKKKNEMIVVKILFIVVSLTLTSSSDLPGRVWPVSNSATMLLPQSSAFGPRQKASESFRFDWHRGVDIPTPLDSDLYAIDDGKIRIAGSHESYSDGVVQLEIDSWFDDGTKVFVNYLHVASSVFDKDALVKKGDVIAKSGASESGFAHVHFEIRVGSPNQRSCVNPYLHLPYADRDESLNVEIVSRDDDDNVVVRAAALPNELDLNVIGIDVVDGGGAVLRSHRLDISAQTSTGETQDLDDDNQWLLDDTDQHVIVAPSKFSSGSLEDGERAVYDITFVDLDLSGGAVQLRAYAIDCRENRINSELLDIDDIAEESSASDESESEESSDESESEEPSDDSDSASIVSVCLWLSFVLMIALNLI